MTRTHLFFAPIDGWWGELIYALDLAAQLEQAGDRVVFAAPATAAPQLRGRAFVALPPGGDLLAAARAAIARARADALILVDVASAYEQLERAGIDAGFADAVGVPLFGLDIWDLECTNMLMERGTAGWILSRHTRDVTRRLIPSPMIRPTGWRDPLSAGVYDSLPADVSPPVAREALRARLGVGAGERLILFPTAPWQQPDVEPGDAYVARLVRALPALLARRLALLGPDVRVVHVGAHAMPELAAALGSRYVSMLPRPRAELVSLLAASDLLLSFNALSPTIAAAALVGVPALVGINSFGGATREEIAAALPFTPSPTTLEWLTPLVPLHPFRVWPHGLYRFTGPIVQDNACVEMTSRFEIFDEEGFVATARALLHDAAAGDAARARIADCLAAVRRLPRAPEIVAHQLGG